MDLAGIRHKSSSTLASCFKRGRKLAGLEVMIMTLLTAELVAIPYYRALADATHSVTLRTLCKAMLSDESLHIGFQAALLLDAQRRQPPWRSAVARAGMTVLLAGTGALVWLRRRTFFQRAGYGWNRYFRALKQANLKAQSAALMSMKHLGKDVVKVSRRSHFLVQTR